MNRLNPSTQATTGLIVAIVGLIILTIPVVRHLTTGTTTDPFLGQLLASQTIDSIGIFLAVLQAGNSAVFLAAIALVLSSDAFKKTRGVNQTSNRIALGAIIASTIVLVAFIVSTVVYMQTIKQVSENIDTRSSSERVRDHLDNDVDVAFGTAKVATDTSQRQIAELTVTVTNKSSEANGYIVVFNAIDKTGKRIAQNSVRTIRLDTGQSLEYTATFHDLSPDELETIQSATFTITSITKL